MVSLKQSHLWVAPLCAALCGLIGLLLLVRQPNVRTATAFGFILAGVSVWLAWRQRSGWEGAVRLLVKLSLLGLGAVNLYHFGSSEQMPPVIAVGFILIAISLLVHFLTDERNHALSRGLSYIVFALAWSAAIGYMYGTSLFDIEPLGHTIAAGSIVAGFLILSVGLVAVDGGRGLPALMTQGNLTAFQFRTLLPTVLLLPFLVGLLVLQWLPLYGPQMAVALTAIGSALIAALILIVSTRYLRTAEKKLRESLQHMNEARNAAEAANTARDRFVSFVSHELRAPLSSALTWVELMELEPGKNNVEDGIKVIKQSIATLVRLIDDLGDVSRLTAGRLAIEPERICLNEQLRNVCTEANPQLAERNIYLRQELPDKPCMMLGDPVRIQQVFRNLLSNAGKYVPAGGRVYVAMSVDDHQATVTIEDNGVGLSTEQCAQIFEPFYRAETQGQGLGVGLAIAKAIMSAHDGSIEVSSGGMDEGCTFTLRFPLISSSLDTSVDLTTEQLNGVP